MSVETRIFGRTSDGRDVKQFIISSGTGRMVSLIEIGACIQGLWVADRFGTLRDVVLGYDTAAEYEANPTFFGAALGRLISRMPDCTLHFEGRDYPLDNIDGMHMHGGVKGFSRVKWDGEILGEHQVRFRYVSPDGEEGYPGEVTAVITYSLDDTGLTIDYSMSADSRTVVNPSNHSYFNLNGHCSGDVRGHTLRCPVTGSFNQLTEESAPLFEGTDLNEERVLGEIFDCRYPSLEAMGGGIDHKFILSDLSANLKDAGTLYSPESGIEMQCTTTMPCIMIYTGNMVDIDGKNYFHYGKHAGVCFETMLFSSLRDMYGSVAVIEPGKEHRSCTRFTFSLR